PDRSGGGTAPEPSGGAPAPSRDAAAAPATAGDPLGQPAVGLSGLSIARFRIPPFLLPIYQAAGTQYGIRWEVLAAINEIETDYGRNLSVSTAGALGWMQFMPATWRTYGVDGNGDGRRDPYNPVDAIFAAARYLRAAGAAQDLRGAIFAYNHADWYVRDVLERARLVARVPADVIGALTGMTLGQLPVYEPPAASGRRPADGAAKADADGWTGIRGTAGAAAVAVQDGTVTRIGESARLGRFVEIRDAYGNRYSYAGLGRLATQHLVPRRSAGQGERERDSRTPTRSGADEAAADDAATGAATTADAAPTLTAVPPAGVPEDPVPTGPASAGRRPSSARLATT
ncbi:lytic transglycosylase domain-containing protein, partial [Patulibacter medicamentivorans]|uniref:lytic transglycosylase domain-containing protein n=1 Tax=Patulibacter medicamentivorans TaxID=1097667 RepID=UPI0011102FCE